MRGNLSPSERYEQIRARLAALGNMSGWRSDVNRESGDFGLYLPEQFEGSCMPDGLFFEVECGASFPRQALLDFLADAPFAVQFLIAVVADQQQEIEQLKRRERALEVPHE